MCSGSNPNQADLIYGIPITERTQEPKSVLHKGQQLEMPEVKSTD
jgi:hypothetical protein